MSDPVGNAYGTATWQDFTHNWRQKDSDWLQKRSVLRYDTNAARNAIATPEIGQVIYNLEMDRLEMRKKDNSWAGLYTIDGLTIEKVGATTDIKLRNPLTAGNNGMVFTTTQIVTQIPFTTAGNEVRLDATGLSIHTGAKTAKLTTDATYLISDSPMSIQGTLTSSLVVTGQTWASDIQASTATFSGLVTMNNYLSLPNGPAAASHATNKAYVDGQVGTRIYRDGDTMSNYLLVHQDDNNAGGLCFRARDVGGRPYMDWMDWAGNQMGYIQATSNTFIMQGAVQVYVRGPYGVMQVTAGDALLQHYYYGYMQVNSGGFIANVSGSVDLRANSGWVSMSTNTGWLFYINGTEYGRIGGPGNGAQFLWGKGSTNSGIPGVELSPHGSINATTGAAGMSCIWLRQMNGANASNQRYISFMEHNGTEMGFILRREFPNGIQISGATVTAPSDYRMKNDLGPVTNALDRVMRLKPRHLSWRAGGEPFDGFFAHEVQEVVPGAVSGVKDEVYTDADEAKLAGKKVGDIKEQQLGKDALVPLLTAAIQELKGRVTALEQVA